MVFIAPNFTKLSHNIMNSYECLMQKILSESDEKFAKYCKYFIYAIR
jgi:hypothetical protein